MGGRLRLHGSSQMHAAATWQLCGSFVSLIALVEVPMHAPFGATSLRTMLNDLMWRCACHGELTPCPPPFKIFKTPNGVSVQLPLFTRLNCPAGVQLLDSVSSRCPAVQYLQDGLVQQVSSCWTVCPAGVQQYNIYRTCLSSKCPAAGQCVQQSNIYTTKDLVVQQMFSCWRVCPAGVQ